MSLPNHFELLGQDGIARTGRLTTPHGVVRTPAFMPVGTLGAMKGKSSPAKVSLRPKRSLHR